MRLIGLPLHRSVVRNAAPLCVAAYWRRRNEPGNGSPCVSSSKLLRSASRPARNSRPGHYLPGFLSLIAAPMKTAGCWRRSRPSPDAPSGFQNPSALCSVLTSAGLLPPAATSRVFIRSGVSPSAKPPLPRRERPCPLAIGLTGALPLTGSRAKAPGFEALVLAKERASGEAVKPRPSSLPSSVISSSGCAPARRCARLTRALRS